MLMRGRVGIEPLVQAADKVGAAVGVPDVAVAHQAVVGPVEVVLDDRADKFLLQHLPHGFKVGVLLIQHSVNVRLAVSRCGQRGQVAPACVDIDNIRVELVQLRRAEHSVLPVLGVFTLVKFRLDAVLQQKQPQLVGHLVGGRAAEDGDFFVQRVRILGQQLAAQSAFFAQQGLGIKRILEAVHGKLLSTSKGFPIGGSCLRSRLMRAKPADATRLRGMPPKSLPSSGLASSATFPPRGKAFYCISASALLSA